MKKIVFVVLMIVMALCGCGQKENKETETSFVGTIIDMTDTSVHMLVEEGDTVLASGNEVTFAITDELKASKNFTPEVGDRLSVIIRGDIAESFPLQVTAVSWAPNFGTGYGYQYGADDAIQVNIDNSWHIFIPYGVNVQDWNKLTEQEKMEQDPTYHSDEVAYRVADGTYIMDSDDESQIGLPSITFHTEDNTFSFTFDILSSYANHGTYFVENDEVVATTSDEKYVFVFQIIDDVTISFVKDKSASTKTVEGKIAMRDGACFNK